VQLERTLHGAVLLVSGWLTLKRLIISQADTEWPVTMAWTTGSELFRQMCGAEPHI
jgi:hypothetical protein